jgi:hypothetical protein
MGSARDFFRVQYSKTRNMQAAREAFAAEVANGAYDGKYYRVVDEVRIESDGKVRLKAVSVSGKLEVGTITFETSSGASEHKWLNEDPDKE